MHGRVQGVFFRETTRRRAQAAGVAGWARNRADGTVEMWLEGERGSVEAIVRFCEDGPRGARVDRVDVEAAEPTALEGFEVL